MILITTIFLFSSLIFSPVSTGQLTVYDLTQDFNNYNLGSQISINFLLETPLSTNSYLRLKLPFDIEGANMAAYYIESDFCSTYFDYKLTTIVASTLTIDSGSYAYLLQFYSDYYSITTTPVTPMALLANTGYKLVVVFNSVVSSGTNTIYPIEMTTISTNSDGFILYDSNHDIGNLYYLNPPAATMQLQIINQNYFYDISTTNNIPITVTPSQSVLNAGRFNLILTNPKYCFSKSQTCLVNYYSTDPTLAVQMPNVACQLESNTSILISIPATIGNPWTYQLNVQVTYPSHYETSNVLVYSLYSNTKTVVETTTTTLIIGTNQVYWNPSTSTVKVGWGVDLKPMTNTLFALYRNGPTMDIYNSVMFYFSPVVSIPATTKGKLIVTFGSTVTIVQNTLAYVLDSYTGTSVSCTITVTTITTITCLNVAGLQANSLYSMKMSLTYDVTNPATVPSDFGLSYYYPMYKGSYTTSSIITSKIYLIIIPTYNNIDRIYQSSSLNYQGVHTKDTITQAVGTSGYGVKFKGSSTYQVLEFDLGILVSDFTSTTIGTSAGLDIYTSGVISTNPSYTYSNADCYSTLGTFNYATQIGVCTIKNGQLASDNSVTTSTLKIGYKVASFAASAWNSGGSYIGFGFNNILIQRHASLYVDAYVLDFYFGFVTSNFLGTGNSATYYKHMLINSFTISIPLTFSNVVVSLSNFWTSAGTGNLAGNYLTAFIRVTGSLAASENAQKFLMFFDYLSGYYDPNPSTTVSHCGSSGVGDCVYYGGLSTVGIRYPMLNRYELTLTANVGASQNFQLVFPVATVATRNTITLFFATVTSGIITNIMGYSKTMTPVNVATWNLINTLGYPSVTGANYGIATRGINKVGDTEAITINTYHTDTLSRFSPNDATHFGAAYTYQTSYNFINNSAPISFSYSLAGSSAGQKCIYFKYLYQLVSYQYIIYCPIYSALTPNSATSSLAIQNFQLPWINGVNLPADGLNMYATCASISNYDGLVLHYEIDDAEQVMIPNILTLPINPLIGYFYIGQIDGQIGFSFTTFNPLPYLSRIAVVTTNTFYLTVSTTENCLIISNTGIIVPEYTCTQSFTGNKFEAYIVLSDTTENITSGSYTLYFYGVDVNDNTPAQQSFFMRTMTGNGDIIDQSSTNLFSYSVQNAPINLQISNVAFDHYNKLARGFCNITFIIGNGTIRSDQSLTFNLEALSETNQEPSFHYMCQVRFALNDSLALIFQSCSFNNYLNEIVLTLKTDLTVPNVLFNLVLQNIRAPSSVNPYNFSLGLYSASLYPLALSNSYQLPSFSDVVILVYPQIVLYKLSNTLGSAASIIFEITTQTIQIDSSATILIKFPHYYTPLFTDKSRIVVFINQDLIQHILIQEHWIMLYALNTIIPINQIFNITITGVDLPYFSGDTANLFVGIYTTNSSNLIEFGEIADFTSYLPNSVSFLNVYNLTVNSIITLDFTNYDFQISFPVNVTGNSSFLLFDFSVDWTEFFFYYPISCYFQLVSNFDFTSIPCFFQGMQVVVNLTSNFTLNTYYIFRLNIQNPEMTNCNLRKFTVSLAPNISVNIFARSPPSLLNIPSQQYYDADNLLSWKFETSVNGVYQEITDITIIRGTYSQQIRWSLISGGRLDQNINLYFQNLYLDEIEMYPQTPVFAVGTNETFFRLGTPEVTPPDTYDIYFYIEQNPFKAIYNRPFALHLHVLDEIIVIPAPSSVIIPVAILGVSLPVIIDMSLNPPYKNLGILTQLNYYPDLGLDYVGSDQFNLNVVNTTSQLIFKSLYIVDAFLTQTVGILVLDENSVGMYDLAVDLISPVLIDNNDANLTYANTTVYSNFSTQFVVQVNCSNVAYIYFHIQNNESTLQRNFFDISTMTQNGFQYDFNDANEENLGALIYNSSGTLQNYTINNLRAGKGYTLSLWSYDLNANSSLINTVNFTTLAKNDSYYVRTKIMFNSSIDANQIQMLSCYFCSFLKLTVNQ